MAEQHPRFVTIDYFIKDMLGLKARSTYYNYLDDAGWPQRVYPVATGKPMLVYDECVAYQEARMAKREPGTFKKSKPPPPPDGKKRRPGRPVKPPKARTAAPTP